jgi:hypothetical protein
MDARWSRCAGKPFYSNGSLIRPAQDCSHVYGGGITFREILLLNEREYREKTVASLKPHSWIADGAIGVHTYDRTSRFEVVDRLLTLRSATQ